MPDDREAIGSAAELAALYPMPQVFDVRLTRADKPTEYETRSAIVVELSIEKLAHIGAILAPMLEDAKRIDNLLALAATHPDVTFNAIAFALNAAYAGPVKPWTVDDVRRMVGIDFVNTTKTIWECNKDFFKALLGPLLASAGLLLIAPGAPGGPMPSPSSASKEISPNPDDSRFDDSTPNASASSGT